MKPIKTFLTEEQIDELASRSNFRYGKKIAKDGDVKIIERKTFDVLAEVKHGDGQRRTVELHSTPKGFRWKCSCSSRQDLFCKHCVATALTAIS